MWVKVLVPTTANKKGNMTTTIIKKRTMDPLRIETA